MPTPLQLINDFPNQTVLVLGDMILDSYLEGSSSRLCREAPVPIIDAMNESRYPGGAANTALNITAMGAHCLLFSAVGKDDEGDSLMRFLNDKGIDTYNVLGLASRKTLFKQRILADNQILLRIDKGSTHPPTNEAEIGLLVEFLHQCYRDGGSSGSLGAVVVSDYGYGTMAPPVLAKLQELHQSCNYPLIIDAKDLRKYAHLGMTAATPNYAEAIALLAKPLLPPGSDRVQQLLDCGNTLLYELNSIIVVVTLDRDGAVVFEQGKIPIHIPTVARKGTVGGAGDTFISAFSLALATGASAEMATSIGVQAATMVVSLPGTAACTHEQLLSSFQNKPGTKILYPSELSRLEQYRSEGAKIIFTNGCFDIIHAGHVQHLREAAAQGDILVVGLNTDQSIKRLKGQSRPINQYGDRLAVLSSLSCVDFVVPLNEDNPIELIKNIRPHIFVKGGDYTYEALPEVSVVEDLGGTVKILPFHAGHSTTTLIEKIQEQYHRVG